MNRIFIPIAVFAVASMLAGCSDNDEPKDGSEITLSASLYDPASPLEGAVINGTTMSVSAFEADGTTVMDNVVASKIENAWHYSPTAYWPSSPVSFYAFSPADKMDVSITSKSQTALFDCLGTTDFLYAAAKDVNRSSGQINMNFYHALARVSFSFCSPNSSVYVLLGSLKVKGVIKQSTFTWPNSSTGIGTPYIPGSWSPVVDKAENLASNVYVIADAQPQPPILSPEYTELNTTMCYFFIPQQLNAMVNSSLGAVGEVGVQVCDSATNAILWPKESESEPDGFGVLTFALRSASVSAWAPAYSYTYQISVNVDAQDAPSLKVDKIVEKPY